MTSLNPEDRRQLFDAARERLRRERRRTVDEREAFRGFERRVRGLDGQGESVQSGVSRTRMVSTSPPSTARPVREAYEATVMSVPHYAEEYGETFEQHFRTEFGPELAALLAQHAALDPHSKQAVLAAASRAQEKRERLIGALDDEQESFTRLEERLLPVIEELPEYETATFSELSFGTLDAYRQRLLVLEENCDDLVDDRQDTLVAQRRNLSLPTEGPDVPTYVYRDLEMRYPIVSTTADVIERIQTLRQDVECALSYTQ